VTVRPEYTVEDAARLMYALRVKRLPVVDAGGCLVGIVSRADMLSVFDRGDEEVHAEIVNLREFLVDPALFTVTVADGVATVKGAPETAEVGHNLVTRIRHVRGVVAVRDELAYPPPERLAADLYF
jgi:CBS-domain-containing membrane protein